MYQVKDVGERLEGEPHAPFDGRALETEHGGHGGSEKGCRERRVGRTPTLQPHTHMPPRQRSTLHGRFYRSRLARTVLQQINEYLMRWAMQKYKRLRRSRRRAVQFLQRIERSDPELFVHWQLAQP